MYIPRRSACRSDKSASSRRRPRRVPFVRLYPEHRPFKRIRRTYRPELAPIPPYIGAATPQGRYDRLRCDSPMSERAGFFADDADVPGLRAAISKLAALGYSETGISNCLGLQDLAGLQWRLVSMYRSERLAGRSGSPSRSISSASGRASAGRTRIVYLSTSEAQVLVRAGLLAIDESGVARRARRCFLSAIT
jgi:hypothetical protein